MKTTLIFFCIIYSSLFFAQDTSYLNELPSLEEINQSVHGNNKIDTYAKKKVALLIVNDAIKGNKNNRILTSEERRTAGRYLDAWLTSHAGNFSKAEMKMISERTEELRDVENEEALDFIEETLELFGPKARKEYYARNDTFSKLTPAQKSERAWSKSPEKQRTDIFVILLVILVLSLLVLKQILRKRRLKKIEGIIKKGNFNYLNVGPYYFTYKKIRGTVIRLDERATSSGGNPYSYIDNFGNRQSGITSISTNITKEIFVNQNDLNELIVLKNWEIAIRENDTIDCIELHKSNSNFEDIAIVENESTNLISKDRYNINKLVFEEIQYDKFVYILIFIFGIFLGNYISTFIGFFVAIVLQTLLFGFLYMKSIATHKRYAYELESQLEQLVRK